jgi:hypothetical protein
MTMSRTGIAVLIVVVLFAAALVVVFGGLVNDSTVEVAGKVEVERELVSAERGGVEAVPGVEAGLLDVEMGEQMMKANVIVTGDPPVRLIFLYNAEMEPMGFITTTDEGKVFPWITVKAEGERVEE